MRVKRVVNRGTLRLLERADGFNAANPIEVQNYAELALASVYIRVARDEHSLRPVIDNDMLQMSKSKLCLRPTRSAYTKDSDSMFILSPMY